MRDLCVKYFYRIIAMCYKTSFELSLTIFLNRRYSLLRIR
jgi:hypothetical protein